MGLAEGKIPVLKIILILLIPSKKLLLPSSFNNSVIPSKFPLHEIETR